MDAEQIKNYKSFEKFIEQNITDHFTIHADFGNFYTVGKPEITGKFRCIYCRSNCGAELVINEETITLQRGDIIAIRPNTSHVFLSYTRTGESYAGFVVDVSVEYMKHLVLHRDFGKVDLLRTFKQHIQTRGTLWEQIDSLFLMALEEQELQSPGWHMGLFASSLILLVQIARAATADPTAISRVDKQELLNGILGYVEANLAERITLEDVANRFFVSASTVTHLFNKQLNVSFYKYVMQRRLWQAQNLIREGMAMEKVASQVGFNDYSVFYRAFKQEFGMSPRQYSKKNGENK